MIIKHLSKNSAKKAILISPAGIRKKGIKIFIYKIIAKIFKVIFSIPGLHLLKPVALLAKRVFRDDIISSISSCILDPNRPSIWRCRRNSLKARAQLHDPAARTNRLLMENAREDLKSVERLNKQVASTCKLRSYQVVPRWLIGLTGLVAAGQLADAHAQNAPPKGAEPRAECQRYSAFDRPAGTA